MKKLLEINLNGNPDHNRYMEEITEDATKKLKNILDRIVAKGKYTKSDFKKIVGFSKWAKEV